ncbi:nickel pincer cofactor biosynthesis protein LarB [candidate division KSB1 bacterium]|nr:MAG: nickel pincer cofactor biosynthesis protein LarB [candidate division KSB1 bacterium]
MNITFLKKILKSYKNGEISENEILEKLKNLPFESIEFATIDHHRAIRKGFPEIIYCEGKTPEQIAGIAEKIAKEGNPLIASRATYEDYTAVKEVLPEAEYFDRARIIGIEAKKTTEIEKQGTVLVITAGTSDIPVAEEAAVTLYYMNHQVEKLFDVGVSGIHRLFSRINYLNEADVIIVAAGMEGALASVIGGIIDKPVIGVPTSVGYGASFNGLAALLGMLNSCASGVTVVNIDNGIGAAYAASIILRQIYKKR